jgi:hypothetical protein
MTTSNHRPNRDMSVTMKAFTAVLALVVLAASASADPDTGAPEKARTKPTRFVKSGLAEATTDFAPQVRALFRVAACGSDDAVPERLRSPKGAAPWIDRHCAEMTALYASYRRAWADRAAKFISALRPSDLPTSVVYPFGGGDLTSALVVFPDAAELTTISLEAAGDVRVMETIARPQLVGDLSTISTDVRRLYRAAHSTTKSLQAASHSELPGTLMFALAGLAVHGMEPVALRYFDIRPDGTLAYLTSGELDRRAEAFAAAKQATKSSKHYWYEQDSPFANVEIQFRRRGDPTGAPRIYRHIVANLDDPHLSADARLLAHLRAKGKVSVLTKAASFLLWYDDFTQIRDYLLQHVAWMISDASGIPPSYAEPAGFEQITYGQFDGPYFIKDRTNVRAQFIKLWRSQPHRPLPFRFGYPDSAKHPHLVITRPRPKA